jgi:hypothetical protein
VAQVLLIPYLQLVVVVEVLDILLVQQEVLLVERDMDLIQEHQ